MKKYQDIAALVLRLALASGFLSAVASRLNGWGKRSSGWNNFLSYTGQVNSFVPKNIIPLIAVASTAMELALGLSLLAGFKTSYAAAGAGFLTLVFALAMSVSFGIKEPLDYSVFVFSAAAFLLAAMPNYIFSIDQFLINKF